MCTELWFITFFFFSFTVLTGCLGLLFCYTDKKQAPLHFGGALSPTGRCSSVMMFGCWHIHRKQRSHLVVLSLGAFDRFVLLLCWALWSIKSTGNTTREEDYIGSSFETFYSTWSKHDQKEWIHAKQRETSRSAVYMIIRRSDYQRLYIWSD